MPAGQGKIVDDAVAEAIEAKPDLGQIPPIKARDMGVPTPEPAAGETLAKSRLQNQDTATSLPEDAPQARPQLREQHDNKHPRPGLIHRPAPATQNREEPPQVTRRTAQSRPKPHGTAALSRGGRQDGANAQQHTNEQVTEVVP